jgi:hypothetical protein
MALMRPMPENMVPNMVKNSIMSMALPERKEVASAMVNINPRAAMIAPVIAKKDVQSKYEPPHSVY